MANVLKYKTSQPTKRALRKGNVVLGIGEENYGPSSTTSYYSGIDVPEGGFVVYTLGLNNNPKIFVAQTEDDLPAIARTLGGGILSVDASKTYLAGLTNTWILDSIPQNTVTDGLVLNLNTRNKSSFTDNIPITNLQPYPTMLPSVTGSIIVSSATYDSNVGGSSWAWSYYPNSNISPDGGMEWHPNVIDPLGNNGAWLMKKRPGGNSESNWSTSSPGAIDETKDYVVSVWCKTNQANCFRIHINTTKNGSSYWGYASSYHSGGGEWERLSVVVPKNSGNTSINTTRCQAIYTNITADAYYKYYQVEEGDTPTDFVDGTRSQNTTWYDLSGNNNSGSLVNGPTFNSKGYLEFDGTNDYCSIPNQSFNSSGDSSFTIEIVFKRNNSTPGNADSLYEIGTGGSTDVRIYFWFDNNSNGQMALNYYAGPGYDRYITLSSQTLDTNFHHAVQIVDKSINQMIGYWDGVNKGSGSILAGSYTSDTTLNICGTNYCDASVGFIKIYNRALSESEVKQNYYGSPIVTDGLVLAVDAGNLVSYESNSTTTYSLTGSFTGSLNNGVGYLPNNGGTWDFDGTDDRIDFGDVLNFGTTDTFSVSVWFNNSQTLASPENIYGLVNKYNVNNINGWTICLRGYSSGIMVRFSTSEGGGQFDDVGLSGVTNDQMSDGNWHNITVTYDSNDLCSVYVDGSLKGTRTYSGYDFTNDKPLSIGSFNYGNSYLNKDKISTTQIYNRALTAQEVLQNFNAQRARFGL